MRVNVKVGDERRPGGGVRPLWGGNILHSCVGLTGCCETCPPAQRASCEQLSRAKIFNSETHPFTGGCVLCSSRVSGKHMTLTPAHLKDKCCAFDSAAFL